MKDQEIVDSVTKRVSENSFCWGEVWDEYFIRVLVRYTRWIERAKWDDVWLMRLLTKFDAKWIAEINEGLRAVKEGRVKPWSEVKEELGIEA